MRHESKYLLYFYKNFKNNEILININKFIFSNYHKNNTFIPMVKELGFKYYINIFKNIDEIEFGLDLEHILEKEISKLYYFSKMKDIDINNTIFYIQVKNKNNIKYLFSNRDLNKLYKCGSSDNLIVLSKEEYIIKNIIE